MSEHARRKLTVFLLTVYAPLLFSLGYLHTDDEIITGGNHETVSGFSLSSNLRPADHGPCLACLFMAGHFARWDAVLPQHTTATPFKLSQTVAPLKAFSSAPSARAPPRISSI